jgi:hypothetical protein
MLALGEIVLLTLALMDWIDGVMAGAFGVTDSLAAESVPVPATLLALTVKV